jgi:hypothetical protein
MTEKKKLGRPKLPKNEARILMLSTRVSGDELKEIQAAIKRDKQEKTVWLRNALLTAAKGGKVAT